MRQVIVILGILSAGVNLYSEPKPKAEGHLRIIDDLPQLKRNNTAGYRGIISITNTGEIAFAVITDEEWSEAIRFYQEGDEETQRLFDEFRGGNRRRENDRQFARRVYEGVVEKYPDSTKILQPGKGISFEYKNIVFGVPYGTPAGVYKAEVYIGYDTWVPVHITPTLYTLFAVANNPEDFFFAKEGTNQWLYVKTDDGKFKRVSEMKPGSKPEKEKDENTVTFELPDGTKKQLTREQARQIINEAGN